MYFQNSKNEINFSDRAYWFSNSDFCSFHNVVFTTWKIGKGFNCKFPEKCLVLGVEHAGKFWLIALLNWKGPCTISELGKALNSYSKLKLGKAVGAKPRAEFSFSLQFFVLSSSLCEFDGSLLYLIYSRWKELVTVHQTCVSSNSPAHVSQWSSLYWFAFIIGSDRCYRK